MWGIKWSFFPLSIILIIIFKIYWLQHIANKGQLLKKASKFRILQFWASNMQLCQNGPCLMQIFFFFTFLLKLKQLWITMYRNCHNTRYDLSLLLPHLKFWRVVMWYNITTEKRRPRCCSSNQHFVRLCFQLFWFYFSLFWTQLFCKIYAPNCHAGPPYSCA